MRRGCRRSRRCRDCRLERRVHRRRLGWGGFVQQRIVASSTISFRGCKGCLQLLQAHRWLPDLYLGLPLFRHDHRWLWGMQNRALVLFARAHTRARTRARRGWGAGCRHRTIAWVSLLNIRVGFERMSGAQHQTQHTRRAHRHYLFLSCSNGYPLTLPLQRFRSERPTRAPPRRDRAHAPAPPASSRRVPLPRRSRLHPRCCATHTRKTSSCHAEKDMGVGFGSTSWGVPSSARAWPPSRGTPLRAVPRCSHFQNVVPGSVITTAVPSH